jgi:hypothetical protein
MGITKRVKHKNGNYVKNTIKNKYRKNGSIKRKSVRKRGGVKKNGVCYATFAPKNADNYILYEKESTPTEYLKSGCLWSPPKYNIISRPLSKSTCDNFCKRKKNKTKNKTKRKRSIGGGNHRYTTTLLPGSNSKSISNFISTSKPTGPNSLPETKSKILPSTSATSVFDKVNRTMHYTPINDKGYFKIMFNSVINEWSSEIYPDEDAVDKILELQVKLNNNIKQLIISKQDIKTYLKGKGKGKGKSQFTEDDFYILLDKQKKQINAFTNTPPSTPTFTNTPPSTPPPTVTSTPFNDIPFLN